MRRFPLVRLAFFAGALFSSSLHAAPRVPNVLFVVAEGLGFSDVGCYGGEAATPCLDWLAERGLKFSQAYHSGEAADSQIALLSGFNARHLQRDLPKNENATVRVGLERPVWGRLLPEHLKAAGYRSYFAGRWLLGGGPKEAGFDRFYTVSETGRQYGPFSQTLDGQALEQSQDSDYGSTLITNRVVQFLKEHAEQTPTAPFFACVNFPMPVAPLQASAEDIERYQRRFHAGTDELRKERLQRLWSMGMLTNAELSTLALPARRWGELSHNEQESFEMRMEIHAAMVEQMDREIGRMLEQLQASKVWDNTMLVFLSSQSASAERVLRGVNDLNSRPGGPASYFSLEAQGASLVNTPWRYSHKFLHEGGIATPLVVHWPGGIKARGELREQVVQVADLAATVLKAAGVNLPKKIGNVDVPNVDGADLSGVLRDNKALQSRGLWWGVNGGRAFRLGDWKWVSEAGRPAELYYLLADRAEMLDLAEANHERLLEMEVQWKRMGDRFDQERGREVPVSTLSEVR